MFKQLANISGFSLERLASLCEVAEAGSIGQAARGDANRQSLLSRQIAELEAVFGAPMLARQSRPYRLTEEGKELALAARSFFQTAEDLRLRVEEQARRVVLGAGETFIQWVLFPASQKLRSGGKVVFAFKNLESGHLVEALQQGVVDVALLRVEEVSPGLAQSPAWGYAHSAFVPANLNRPHREIKARDLGSLPWAVLEGQGHFRGFLQTQAKQAGVKLNVTLECSSYAQVAQAILSGRHAGFLPSFARTPLSGHSEVIQKPLEVALRYEREVVLAWREATTRSRPFLTDVLAELQARVGRFF